jgi:DNA replication protein DnaC
MFQEIFQSNSPQVLYIGQNFTKTDEFLLQHPWSCIISSSSDFSIHEKIANESRRPTPVYNFNDAKKYIKLSTKYPCVIYLKNTDNQINNIHEKFARKKEISSILNLFPELLADKFGSVFIFGYSNSNNDIPSEHLYEFLSQLGKKSSFFFFDNLNNISNDEYLNGLENSGYSQFITEDIHDIFDELIIKDEESYTEDYIKETDIHLYINKKRIYISKKSIFETKGYATLLCEEEVKTINIPSYLQTEYYQKFLQESASLPLWFGYEYNFYLQRDFEKKIIEKLNGEFNITNVLDNGQPIFLYGQTCSGKTMAIRSIAYKYYVERKYPVIYISNPDINLNRDYDYFKALDHLLQELEDKGSSRTLLIWDNSPNINQMDVTMRLFNALRTRGRKFVLLVTSYVRPELKKVKTEYASIELSEIELSELEKNILSNEAVSKPLKG